MGTRLKRLVHKLPIAWFERISFLICSCAFFGYVFGKWLSQIFFAYYLFIFQGQQIMNCFNACYTWFFVKSILKYSQRYHINTNTAEETNFLPTYTFLEYLFCFIIGIFLNCERCYGNKTLFFNYLKKLLIIEHNHFEKLFAREGPGQVKPSYS